MEGGPGKGSRTPEPTLAESPGLGGGRYNLPGLLFHVFPLSYRDPHGEQGVGSAEIPSARKSATNLCFDVFASSLQPGVSDRSRRRR